MNTLKANGKPSVVACIPAFDDEKSIAKVVIKASSYVDKVIVREML